MRLGRLVASSLCLVGCSLLAPSQDELGADFGKTDSGIDASTDVGNEANVDSGVCPGQKECAESCVELDDPTYGCGAASCEACAAIENATPSCVGESCGLVFCENGWLNADEDAANGCEQAVTHPSRGLVLFLRKDFGLKSSVPVLWEDASGNDWNASGAPESFLNPVLLTNDAIWFDGNDDSLTLGPRNFDLSNGFTLALIWTNNPGGKIFSLETPAGRLALGPKDSTGNLALQLGATTVTTDPTGKTGDMLTVVQQAADGSLSMVVNDNEPRGLTPSSVPPLETASITEGTLGNVAEGNEPCQGSIQHLMFFVHAPNEPPPVVSEVVAYLQSLVACCKT